VWGRERVEQVKGESGKKKRRNTEIYWLRELEMFGRIGGHPGEAASE
jgi:hypothetical protein